MSRRNTDFGPESGRNSKRKTGKETLTRFSRNRYFNGKLITARVMQTEQEYHAGRLETLSRQVAGKGVVCGLGTSVSVDADEGVTISLDPGVAIDNCGRLVVVEGVDKVPFEPQEVPPEEFSVFIELAPCEAEKVTRPGSEDACGESCEYNRIVEDYRLRLVEGAPEQRKPIPDVEFPSKRQKEEIANAMPADPPHFAKSKPARTFYGESDSTGPFNFHECAEDADPKIFLGYYEQEGGNWTRQKQEPRQFVYSNDMLYSAIVSHATDVANPHDVVTSIDNVEHENGNVALRSDDDTINTSESEAGGISIELAAELQTEIDALAEHVRNTMLKDTIKAFYEVADRYNDVENEFATQINQNAREIIKAARVALSKNLAAEESNFIPAALNIVSLELAIARTIDRSIAEDSPQASENTFESYETATNRLEGPIPSTTLAELRESDQASTIWDNLVARETLEDLSFEFDRLMSTLSIGELVEGFGDTRQGAIAVTELTVVMQNIAEAARQLELTTPPTMVLPGGDEAVPARIIQGVIDPTIEVHTGFSPGDMVIDTEAEGNQTAVVIKNPDERADEWTVYAEETVADRNYRYDYVDDDDRVVLVVYKKDLDENWELWQAADPDDLFYQVLDRSIKFYAFPASRLQWAAVA